MQLLLVSAAREHWGTRVISSEGSEGGTWLLAAWSVLGWSGAAK